MGWPDEGTVSEDEKGRSAFRLILRCEGATIAEPGRALPDRVLGNAAWQDTNLGCWTAP